MGDLDIEKRCLTRRFISFLGLAVPMPPKMCKKENYKGKKVEEEKSSRGESVIIFELSLQVEGKWILIYMLYSH